MENNENQVVENSEIEVVENSEIVVLEDSDITVVKDDNQDIREFREKFIKVMKAIIAFIVASSEKMYTLVKELILRPVTFISEKSNKYDDVAKSSLLAIKISGFFVALNLVASMITCIFVREMNWYTGGSNLNIDFSQISNLDYTDLIFIKFFIYVGIIFMLVMIQFLASKLFKKDIKLSASIVIATLSIVPYLLLTTTISQLLGLFSVIVGVLSMVLFFIHSLVLFMVVLNTKVVIENDNAKVYFNILIVSVIIITIFLCVYYFMVPDYLRNFIL